jgi:hypothetical protein
MFGPIFSYRSSPLLIKSWVSPNTQRTIFLTSLFLNDERKLNSEDSKKMTRECVETLKYEKIMCLLIEISFFFYNTSVKKWNIEHLTFLF